MANTPKKAHDEVEVEAEVEKKEPAVKAGDPIVPEPDPTPAPGEVAAGGEFIEVETTGPFMLLDPYTGDVVKHEGKSKVRKTTFIQTKIDEGQLKEV